MDLDRLIKVIVTDTYQDLENNQSIILSTLQNLGIKSEDQQEFLKIIFKIMKISKNPKTRESYLKSYFRIYNKKIYGDGRGGSIVIEITKKCTKNCIHCYSKYTGQREKMSDDTLHAIIKHARTQFKHIFLTGGEPSLDHRVFSLAEDNSDILFFMFTDGGPVTKNYAQRLSSLGNLIPMISIDGSSSLTHDYLRGKGSFQEAIEAVDNLNEYGVPWGYISIVTEKNIHEVLSKDFIQDKIKRGAFIARYIEYIPVGPNPQKHLILSGESYFLLEKRKKEIIESGIIYMQDTTQMKCNGLLYFDVDGNIKNCFCFHYSKYNIADDDIEKSIKKIRKEWTSYNWSGECPIYADPFGFKKHLEKLGWKSISNIDEEYLSNPDIIKQLVQNYKQFIKLKNQQGL